MTILLTGGTGQLATALAEAGGGLVRRVGRPEFDFDHPETVEAAFRAAAPSLVVNAAAYTAVDAAETDTEAAYRANRDGPALLARLCAEAGVPLIHVSTDYVFDGLKGAPYVEDDPTSPTGVYGASKLAGEQAVLESGARAIVLRTSWVYAATGKNFVRTMLGAAQRMPRLRVVADQKGCPTNAADLAAAILTIAARLERARVGRPVRRRLPRRRKRLDDVARPRVRGVRGGREARDDPARGGADHHGGLADAGAPAAGFAAGLREAGAGVRGAVAGVAGESWGRRWGWCWARS